MGSFLVVFFCVICHTNKEKVCWDLNNNFKNISFLWFSHVFSGFCKSVFLYQKNDWPKSLLQMHHWRHSTEFKLEQLEMTSSQGQKFVFFYSTGGSVTKQPMTKKKINNILNILKHWSFQNPPVRKAKAETPDPKSVPRAPLVQWNFARIPGFLLQFDWTQKKIWKFPQNKKLPSKKLKSESSPNLCVFDLLLFDGAFLVRVGLLLLFGLDLLGSCFDLFHLGGGQSLNPKRSKIGEASKITTSQQWNELFYCSDKTGKSILLFK